MNKQLSLSVQEAGKLGGSAKSPAKTLSSKRNGAKGGRPISPVLNPDGVSIKGCSYIYAPRGQAGEYAPLATNIYRGCSHSCAYCYVPLVLKMDRARFNAGAVPRTNFMQGKRRLQSDATKYKALGVTEQVMLCFTTDPYHPHDNSLTRETIHVLQAAGLGVCTLTKGGTRALRDIDLFRPDRDCFATTLTSLDSEFSKKWEPGAALPDDRIEAIKAFHDAGIFTWVSLEPTLDVDSSIAIVKATHKFVDLYKVGRVNYLPMTKTTDWEEYTHRMVDLLGSLGKAHYIKKDLQQYLPEGYHNPLRVDQHH
ncbi:MAG: radical SAM protein [Planctomycetes bacterium]|nr:radical SAM protein [Planctomycetota bacterium]